jgi:hypothetical protein
MMTSKTVQNNQIKSVRYSFSLLSEVKQVVANLLFAGFVIATVLFHLLSQIAVLDLQISARAFFASTIIETMSYLFYQLSEEILSIISDLMHCG